MNTQSEFSAIILALFVSVIIKSIPVTAGGNDFPPPVAEQIAKIDTTHGDVRIDNYFWLRDKTDPDVIDYLTEENAYTDTIMSSTKALQEKLYNELVARIKETDLTVPNRHGDYYYYSRTEQGKQYSIYCRKRGNLDAAEEIILDQNELAKAYDYFSLGDYKVSDDHNLLAYSVDTTGSEQYTIFVKDLRSGAMLADTIFNTGGSVVWANDNRTLFYDALDEALRPYRIYRHQLNAAGEDFLVFEEPDQMFFVGISKTKSKAFLVIELGSKTSSEVHYLDANNPTGQFKVIHSRQREMEYSIAHHSDRFYIVTNDNAKNFKLMSAPTSDPAKKNWREVLPYQKEIKLDGIDAFRDHLIMYCRKDGFSQVRVLTLQGGGDYFIDFPEPVFEVSPGTNLEFNTSTLRFNYQSLVTPKSVFDFDLKTKARELKKQDEVRGDYDAKNYQSERTYATADGGVKVPISLVYRKDRFRKDGTNPLFLYGYGAYGISIDPWFSTNRVSLLDRGFVFAIAHVRGGGEMGREWYEDGKLMKKKNTFTDYFACAEHLVKENFGAKDKLIAYGGSAGGLLIGAAINMRPDLFKIALADVPFVDVMNTMLDPTIPLTVTEYEEWGNANEKASYDYMKSYSPYDNVAAKAYPHILIQTSLNDPRVAYWEPAKWCAKLRTIKTGDNLLLLKTNMEAGHGGASGRYERFREIAFEYAFIFRVLGISE